MANIIKCEAIEKFMKDKKLCKTKFCKLCRVQYRTFKKIMSNDLHFRVKALFRIAKFMNVEVVDLLN